eukprot:209670-Hanusia_phi.AAC.1
MVATRRESAGPSSSWASRTKRRALAGMKTLLSSVESSSGVTEPAKSQTLNWRMELWSTSCWTVLTVLSRKSVSCGDILWKTTLKMLVLPLLLNPISRMRGHLVALKREDASTSDPPGDPRPRRSCGKELACVSEPWGVSYPPAALML